MPEDDTQLLLRMLRGHEPSAAELWRRHAPRLVAYARAVLGRRDPDGARDVVQSVFLAALRVPRAEAKGIRDVAGWMLLLTRHAALNRVRALRRERVRMAAMSGPAHSGPHDAPELAAAVDRLPRPMREVVVLKHMAGLTF